MNLVYNPFFTNNRRYDNEEVLNEKIVFQTIVDCEQYIINKGYSVRIQYKDKDYYITAKSHELLLENKELIIKEQEEQGINDKDLNPLFAITDSTYHCPCYQIITLEFVEKIKYEQDIQQEIEREKRQKELDKNIENLKGFGNDLASQWNNSNVKKSANSFFSGLSKKTKDFIESIPDENLDNNYITDYDLESYLVENNFLFDKSEKKYIIYTQDYKELIEVDRENEYIMNIKPDFNQINPDEKQKLHSFVSKYISTPISERTIKKEKYEINSEYLKEGVNKKRFITLEQAERYVDLINNSISINEIDN